jgi:hypothetical protein
MADWQLGKADYGVENTLKRYEEALIKGVNQIKALRKTGTEIDEIYLLGLGDLQRIVTNLSIVLCLLM